MGNLNYTQLTDATAVASPSPASSSAGSPAASGGSTAPSVAPTAAPVTGSSGNGSPVLLIGIVVLVVLLAVGFLILRNRSASGAGGEEE
jgi:hypothetical protein